jgi:hypothetical protein
VTSRIRIRNTDRDSITKELCERQTHRWIPEAEINDDKGVQFLLRFQCSNNVFRVHSEERTVTIQRNLNASRVLQSFQ